MAAVHRGRTVEVVPHDKSWKIAYSKEEKRLRTVLGKEIVEIHHIGSTAIPGMPAKPVIDIMVAVRDIERIDRYNDSMAKIGYVAMGEYGIEGRRFFTKGGDQRTHHVHVFETGSSEIARHLRFRDYMIAHPKDAAKYGRLKQSLAARFPRDIDAYCDGKDRFIKKIDEEAAALEKASK